MLARFLLVMTVVSTGTAVIRLNLKRHSVPLEQSLRWRSPMDLAANGSITPPAENETVYWDNFYVAEVGMGTPPQTAYLVMDTGSSNLWFMDVSCPCGSSICKRYDSNCMQTCPAAVACCNGDPDGCNSNPKLPPKRYFDPSKSTTYHSNNTSISCSYGLGFAQGPVGTDTCSVGGIEITKQTFFSATLAAGVFYSQPMSGIFGLGYQSLAVSDIAPPVINMIKNGLIDDPIFSVWMEVAPSGTVGGEVVFGGVDDKKFSGEMHYVNVTRHAYWQYTLNRIGLPNSNYTKTGGYQAISDTGTSFIIGPSDVIEPIATELQAVKTQQGIYVIDCARVSSLPNITFEIGGKQFAIDPESYVIEIEGAGCVVAMQGQDMPNIDWILGDSFMRNWYHVFDFGKNRVGLAQAYQAYVPPISAASGLKLKLAYVMLVAAFLITMK